jgi:tRNA 2-selenouridine synthase
MNTISMDQFLELTSTLIVDTRSPAEFDQGRIPGAINIPLLENEERAIVGTLYKQKGPISARQKGLEIVSGKLADMVGKISDLLAKKPGATLVIYCWRGGMRSQSFVTILELMDIHSVQLVGGYKSYRQYVLNRLNNFIIQPPMIVLCGSTGTGKTTLLQLLAKRGYPVIDLEKLANHRGSAFGQIGLGKSSTAQNFDAELLQTLCRYDAAPYVLIECESKRVGNVYLPEALHSAMKAGQKILVRASRATRVQRLIEEYTDTLKINNPEILSCIASLEKRLGRKKTSQLMLEYEAGNLRLVTEVLLSSYYDPLYGYEDSSPTLFDLVVDAENLTQAVDVIAAYVDRFKRG